KNDHHDRDTSAKFLIEHAPIITMMPRQCSPNSWLRYSKNINATQGARSSIRYGLLLLQHMALRPAGQPLPFVKILIGQRLPRGLLGVPQQSADLLSDVQPNGVDDVLIPLGHGCAGGRGEASCPATRPPVFM